MPSFDFMICLCIMKMHRFSAQAKINFFKAALAITPKGFSVESLPQIIDLYQVYLQSVLKFGYLQFLKKDQTLDLNQKKDCLLCCSYFKHKHIVLITTFGHSTFSNHYLVFKFVHSNNPKNDLPHLLYTTALNNSLNLECFTLNQTLAECYYSFKKVSEVIEYFINFLNHVVRYNFASQLDQV